MRKVYIPTPEPVWHSDPLGKLVQVAVLALYFGGFACWAFLLHVFAGGF